MFRRQFVFAVLAICPAFAGTPVFAQSRTPDSPSAKPTTSGVLEHVPTVHREAVSKVLSKPTLSAKYTEEPFRAHESVYPWLLEHPDRVAMAWKRMNVPCEEIGCTSDGGFTWSDEHGSQLTWRAVAKLTDGVIWYASGKVKAALLLPMVPVKAVAVVKYTSKPTEQAGIVTLTPQASVYLLSESRAANALLRMVGPAAPKLAEDGAEQMLFFFSGVATHLKDNPEKVPTLLAEKKAR